MNSENLTWSDRKRRKTLQLFAWTLAWLVSFALATFGPQLLWDATLLTWLAIGANLALGVGVVIANMRHLASVDELERKISLDAMALTLGVGFVVGFGYGLFEGAGLTQFDAGPHHLLTLMALVLIAATLAGVRRHL